MGKAGEGVCPPLGQTRSIVIAGQRPARSPEEPTLRLVGAPSVEARASPTEALKRRLAVGKALNRSWSHAPSGAAARRIAQEGRVL